MCINVNFVNEAYKNRHIEYVNICIYVQRIHTLSKH